MAENNKNQSNSMEDVLADFRKNSEYQKAERLIRPYYELATEIINRRVKLGLTQKDLAEKANTYQSRISKIENGEFDIRLSTLISLAEALDCQISKSIIVPIEDTSFLPNITPFVVYEVESFM